MRESWRRSLAVMKTGDAGPAAAAALAALLLAAS